MNKFFISPLPAKFEKQELEALISSSIGEVKNLKVVMDKNQWYCQGFGFVTFKKDLINIDGKKLNFMGRSIEITKYKFGKELENSLEEDYKKRIFLKNVPYWMNENIIKNRFSIFGDVISAFKIKNKQGGHSRCAVLNFKNEDSAKKCVKKKSLSVYNKQNSRREKILVLPYNKTNSMKSCKGNSDNLKPVPLKNKDNFIKYLCKNENGIRSMVENNETNSISRNFYSSMPIEYSYYNQDFKNPRFSKYDFTPKFVNNHHLKPTQIEYHMITPIIHDQINLRWKRHKKKFDILWK